MNRNGKTSKQAVFLSEQLNAIRYRQLQHVFDCCFSALTQPHIPRLGVTPGGRKLYH